MIFKWVSPCGKWEATLKPPEHLTIEIVKAFHMVSFKTTEPGNQLLSCAKVVLGTESFAVHSSAFAFITLEALMNTATFAVRTAEGCMAWIYQPVEEEEES